jgi:hypothetical protein
VYSPLSIAALISNIHWKRERERGKKIYKHLYKNKGNKDMERKKSECQYLCLICIISQTAPIRPYIHNVKIYSFKKQTKKVKSNKYFTWNAFHRGIHAKPSTERSGRGRIVTNLRLIHFHTSCPPIFFKLKN